VPHTNAQLDSVPFEEGDRVGVGEGNGDGAVDGAVVGRVTGM